MKYIKRIKIIFIIISILFLSIKTFSSQYISPFIKVGMNINKMYSDGKYSYFDYSYPLGYLIGISNDSKITNHFYIANSLYLKNKNSKMYFYPAAGIRSPYVFFTSHYIRFSSIVDLRIIKYINLLLGVDFGRVINKNIDIYSHDGDDKFKFSPKNYEKFDTAICLGLGKNLKLYDQKYKIELKYLIGLTKYKFFDPELGSLKGPVKNNGLQLEIGYKILQ